MNEPPMSLPIAEPGPEGRACMNCGYALDGLALEGVCPECGTPVRLSLRPDRLVFASPRWLRGLHLGFVHIELSAAFLIANAVLGGMASHLGVLAAPPVAVQWVGMSLNMLFTLVELRGWWLVTASEPSREATAVHGGVLRRWVRGLMIFGAGLRLSSSLILGLQLGVSTWGLALSVLASLLHAIMILVAMTLLEGFAVRASHAPLLRTMRLVRSLTWVTLVECVLNLGSVALVQLGLAGAMSLVTCVRIPFWFAWLAWAINYVRVVDGCRGMTSRALRRAEFLVASQISAAPPEPVVPRIP